MKNRFTSINVIALLVLLFNNLSIAPANAALPPLLPISQKTPGSGPYLRMRRGAFDPLAGEPPMEAKLRSRLAANQPGLRLVQFTGPIKDAWYRKMTASGLQVISYLPDYGYLVWGSQASVTKMGGAASLRWSGLYHPYYALDPTLVSASGQVDVLVQLFAFDGVDSVIKQIVSQAAASLRVPVSVGVYRNLGIRIASSQLDWLAALPGVIEIEPMPEYRKLDEVQGQIMAGQLNPGGSAPTGPGYLAWLAAHGFPSDPSAYPVVDISDDGVDNGTVAPLHPDFYQLGIASNPSRIVYNNNWTTSPPSGKDGHGNINASIIGGYNDKTGFPYEDSAGYNYGLGINPFARIGVDKIFCDGGNWCLPGDNYSALVSYAYTNGARISSNSWGAKVYGAYNTDAQAYDILTRDAVAAQPGNQEMAFVFSAGNDGPNGQTVGSPGTAKNVITVGASESVRPTWKDGCLIDTTGADNAQDIAGFSSRGPASDGRMKPDLVAPGTHIEGAASQAAGYSGAGVCDTYMPAGQTLYAASSGTSHAAPAVAGAASLVYQWYQAHFGAAPSPAMLKAYLTQSARYLSGVSGNGSLPTSSQGYGEVNLGLAFDSALRTARDQGVIFQDSGEAYTITGTIPNASLPFRVTLAWTDAPGPVNTSAAYVNNLNLEVTVNGVSYKGNVFSGQWSAAGGAYDSRNNLESVFLPPGASGAFTVTVHAANIAGDGVPGNADPTDQDFALLVYNGVQGGWLDGVVSSGGAPLSGATVQAVAGSQSFQYTTGASGYYTLTIPSATYTLKAWKNGYQLFSQPGVGIVDLARVTIPINLDPAAPGSLSGGITDSATGEPLEAALQVFDPLGRPLLSAEAPLDTGHYALDLYQGAYSVTVSSPLHIPMAQTVTVNGPSSQDFTLAAATTDGLLRGKITRLLDGSPISGAAISLSPGNYQAASGMDGSYLVQVPPGPYTVTVAAPLFSTTSESGVTVRQSNITGRNFTLASSKLQISQPAYSVSLNLGQTAEQTLTISNTGQGSLSYNLEEITQLTAQVPPDPFGYTYHKSGSSDGVKYQWADITDGLPLNLGEDQSKQIPLPFSFTFYGTPYDALSINENGVAWFGSVTPGSIYFNSPLTTTADINLVAPFWDDLAASGGNVFYKTLGAAPYREFIVEWYKRPHYNYLSPVGDATFEAIFYESTNNIKFQYQDTNFGSAAYDNGVSATSGIRQTGSNFQQYSYNQARITDGLALCFQYPDSLPCDSVDIPWLNESSASGSLPPGGTQDIILNFDSSAVASVGIFTGSLRIYTNAPDAQPFIQVPVSLTVGSPPAFAIGMAVSSSQVQAGDVVQYTITVTNTGSAASGVTVEDPLPDGLLYSSASDNGQLVNGKVTWSGLSLPQGGHLMLTWQAVVGRLPAGTVITNLNYKVYEPAFLASASGAPVLIAIAATRFFIYLPLINNP